MKTRRNRYEEIIDEVKRLYRETPRHIDGGILGSMTTWPHPLGAWVYRKFLHVNGNDPVVFKSVAECERRLIRELGSLFGARHGLHTSGGTESNILAIYAAKRLTNGKVVIAPSSVHKSIDKACLLMDCKLVKIPVHPLKPVDPKVLENYIKEYKPSVVVTTAGTTETGIIDPIEEVSELAVKHGFYLHVDAAYGGLLIPFLYKHGLVKNKLYMFDGVSSITVDMHKVGMAPIPSSVLFTRDQELVETMCFEMEYMPRGKSCGILGTRPGGAVIASYYTWRAIGRDGYEKIAIRLMNLAEHTYRKLKAIESLEVFNYTLPILVFRSSRINTKELLALLMERKLYLYRSPSLDALRVVLMPHHRKTHIDRLARTLRNLHES